jgi:hypothetical protein
VAQLARRGEQAKQSELVAQKREAGRLGIEATRISRHMGWSGVLGDQFKALASDNRHDAEFLGTLRDEAVEGLIGFDATEVRHFRNEFGAKSFAFNSKGSVLMGGVTDPKDHRRLLPSRIWEGDPLTPPRLFARSADGPVGFLADDTPIQLVENERSVVLFDLETDGVLRRIPLEGRRARSSVMLPDGSRVVTIADPDTEPGGPEAASLILSVWDTASGQELRRFEGPYLVAAFSPDGRFVAAGDDLGRVTIWSLESGEPARKRQPRAAADPGPRLRP